MSDSNLPEYSSREMNYPTKEIVAGAGSLVEHVDKRIFVWLRDGRKYVGILRSVDTFANLVLHNAVERIQIGDEIGDVPQGVIVVRGENVALLGETQKETSAGPSPNRLVGFQAAKERNKERIQKLKAGAYLRRGLIYTPEDYF